MVIVLFLQLSPGVYALFCHYASGKYSKKKSSNLGIFYILGAEIISACLFLSCYFITFFLFLQNSRPETSIFAWIEVGILIALAIISFFFYYRDSKGSELFIPRKISRSLNVHARTAKTRSDAFILGAFSGLYELPFTLPLLFIVIIELTTMGAEHFSSYLLSILYIVAPIIPLLITRWSFESGHNLANIIKNRIKNKHFIRFILSVCYLTIALLIICFRITNS